MVVETEPQTDRRGSFERLWCSDQFEKNGLMGTFVQSSLSRNERAFTVRGLHYQVAPSKEAKLVTVVSGRVFDVVVDLREESPTYNTIFTTELAPGKGSTRLLYIPPQCAHGFQTLEDDTAVLYCMTQAYDARFSRTLHWRSPRFDIVWPRTDGIVISENDAVALA
jgi:dTDP-4-dehydrorhamnose 3,5-epimerase